MRRKQLFVLLFLLLACGHVPQTRYFLVDVPAPARATAGKQVTLWIKAVDADAVHGQDRLLYRTSEYEVHYDPYRRWALMPAEMIQQKVLDYLRQSSLFRHVTERMPEPGVAVWSATITIRQFEEVVTSRGRVGRVAMRWQVNEGQSAKIVWEGEVQAEAAIQGSDAEGIIQAISKATESTLQQALQKLQSL
jgi:uncharacterized lipoprotein YmbA